MIFVVWFWFSKDILAKRNEGRAIKEICTFKLVITNGQCCIFICGCGMNKRYVIWTTNWGKEINHIKRVVRRWNEKGMRNVENIVNVKKNEYDFIRKNLLFVLN